MKQLLEIIKLFLEKHFIPAVAAIALGLIAIIFVPSDWFVVSKLGINWFRLLVLCLALLIVEGVIKLYQYIVSKINEAKEKEEYIRQQTINEKREQERQEEYIKKSIDDIWKFVDGLCVEDRKCIEKFLKTGNAPIQLEDTFMPERTLFYSKAVHKTTVKDPVDDYCHATPAVYQYKLVDSVYELLKIGKEKYGKISHFN